MAEIEVVDVATASERTDSPRLVQTEQTDLAASAQEPVQEEPVPPPPVLERAASVAEPKAKAKKAAARKPRAAPVKPSKPPPSRAESPARWVEPPRIASHLVYRNFRPF